MLIIGPTGSGKGTLLKHIAASIPGLVFPRSCTTRNPRPGEKDGETYFFVSKEEFERRIEEGDFLEYAQYGGNWYGTLKSEILPAIEQGKVVVREVEVQGARQIREKIPAEALRIVYVDAGSWDELERRIVARAPIEQPELIARRKRYEDETSFKKEAVSVIENPDGGLEQAKQAFEAAIRAIAAE